MPGLSSRRNLAFSGVARGPAAKSLRCVASLAFVALLAAAFWAGAVWLSELLVNIGGPLFGH